MPASGGAIRGSDIQVGTPTVLPGAAGRGGAGPLSGAGIRSTYSEEQLAALEMATDCIKSWRDTGSAWRDQARRCSMFFNGRQWEDQSEVARLKAESRAPLTINQISPYVNVVCGLEIQMRGKIIFLPRRPTAAGPAVMAELATAVYDWAMDSCHGHDERSRAFMDLVIKGMGWTHQRIDIQMDPDGQFVSEHVAGDEMAWDTFSTKRNLEDAAWVARRRWTRMSEIEKRWPKHAEAVKASFDPSSMDVLDFPAKQVHTSATVYKADGTKYFPARPPGLGADAVLLTDFQYKELVTRYEVKSPIAQDKTVLLTKKELNDLQQYMPEQIEAKELQIYVFKQLIYVGDVILEGGDDETGMLPIQDGFSYLCMTGWYDEENMVWYGLVPCLIDPQKGWNKYISQAITIWSHSPKGTVFIETDAVTDPRRLPALWTSPASVIPVTPDALQKGKIKVEQSPPLSAAAIQLAQIFASGLKLASGMSLDMLGMSEGDQPAQLMRQRQGQGMAILGVLFEAHRRFRETEARQTVSWVRKYLADGRTVRIGPLDDPQIVQLWEDPIAGRFDIYVDENPQNPSTKMEYWEAMQPIIPTMMRQGIFVPEILDFAPIPSVVRIKLKQEIGKAMAEQKAMAKQQQGQQGGPQGQPPKSPQEVQAEIMETLAKTGKVKAETQLTLARTEAIQRESDMDAIATQQELGIRKGEAFAGRVRDAVDTLHVAAQTADVRSTTAHEAHRSRVETRATAAQNAAEVSRSIAETLDGHKQSEAERYQKSLTRK
jgi:hypothetical protein